jgi:hypothetical protein
MMEVFRTGNLNILEPSGPVQACTEIGFPFTAPIIQRKELTQKLEFNKRHQKLTVPSTECTGVLITP